MTNKCTNWEMIAVVITLVGVIYMIGKKEGTVTSAVEVNRLAIQDITVKVDALNDYLREKSQKVSYDHGL